MGVTTDRGVEVGVDYWEFTCPWERGRSLLYSFPGGYEVRRNQRGDVIGWRGYTHSALVAQGKGRVGWSPEDRRMGVHFSLGSEALSVLAALDEGWRDLSTVMEAVHEELDGHSTRVDLCWDETSGLLDLAVVRDALRNRDYTARWRDNWRYIESTKGTRDHGPVRGETIYMGSSKSDTQLRCYDKRAERLQKGHEVEVDHWVRVELQLRRKRADAVSRLWAQVRTDAEAVVTRLTGFLRSMVEFKDASSRDTNATRRPVAGWWARFLGFCEKASVEVVQAEARTVEDLQAWVDRQVGPSLALVEEKLGFAKTWAWLYEVVQDGRSRWGPRHKAILMAGEAVA
mgnify:CR=1 FL=1